MKALLLTDSPKQNGRTFTVLREVKKTLMERGIKTQWMHLCKKAIAAASTVIAAKAENAFFTATSSTGFIEMRTLGRNMGWPLQYIQRAAKRTCIRRYCRRFAGLQFLSVEPINRKNFMRKSRNT